MQFSTLTASIVLLATTAMALPSTLEVRKGGPPTNRGGPASATISIYPSFNCSDLSTPPPTDGSAGTPATVTVTELQCAVLPIPLGAAITGALTLTPKIGTLGCYIQIYEQQGCGVILGNDYHGFPFSGIAVGDTVGCVAPVGGAYGAVEIICD